MKKEFKIREESRPEKKTKRFATNIARWISRSILLGLGILLVYGVYKLSIFGHQSLSGTIGVFQNPIISDVVKEKDPNLDKLVEISSRVSERIAKHSALPQRSALGMGWLTENQASNSASMAELIETLAIELGSSEALGTIRTLRENHREARTFYEQSQSVNAEIAAEAKQAYDEIVEENKILESNTKRILENEGMSFTDAEIKSLCVSPNAEDTLILISAFGSLKKVALKMEDRLRNFPSLTQAQRYYGAYCVLLIALDKIQKESIRRIEEDHIPNAQKIAEETEITIEQAQEILSDQGREFGPSASEARALLNNIETCKKTIEISERTQRKLLKNLEILSKANRKLETSIAAAKNSHMTAMLQKEIVELETTHLEEISQLQGLTIPELAAVNFADPEHPEVYEPLGVTKK